VDVILERIIGLICKIKVVENLQKLRKSVLGALGRHLRFSLIKIRNNQIPELTNEVTDEFLNRSFLNPALDIQFNVTADEEKYLIDRIQEAWNKMGEEEPFWSVITDEKYLAKNISQNRDEFYESGKASIEMLISVLTSIGLSKGQLQNFKVLELGCGLGRLTFHLASNFKEVMGLDISPSHIESCRNSMNMRRKENVKLSLIKDLDSLNFGSDFDVFYSIITLQHNPPPVQFALLTAGLSSLRKGGVFYFQLPTYIPRYTFSVEEYSKMPTGQMEMHAIPQSLVLDFLRLQGCDVKSVLRDNMTGYLYDSYTFVGIKN